MKRLILVLAILLLLPVISAASSFEDGKEACRSGDYQSAWDIFRGIQKELELKDPKNEREDLRKKLDQAMLIMEIDRTIGQMKGRNLTQDTEKFKRIKKDAEKGKVESQFQLGKMYEKALGVYECKNPNEAIKWYAKAAKQGHPGAQYSLGEIYRGNRFGDVSFIDHNRANKWFIKAAEQGNAPAQAELGWKYLFGERGFPKNHNEAFNWCQQSALQENWKGQRCLGFLYFNGWGLSKDYSKAFKWHKKAAEQGNQGSQIDLGKMYEEGLGVDRDYAEAAKWYGKAAEKGNTRAQYNLARMHRKGLFIITDQELKNQYLDVEQRAIEFQLNMGLQYETGEFFPQDYKEALRYYRKAAEQGHAEAQFNLGKMYVYGKGVPTNYTEGVKWYRKAAEQGLAKAQTGLGHMYRYGEGVPQDYIQAHKWYNLAASNSQGELHSHAMRHRDLIEKKMTLNQVEEAQKLAREWKPEPTQ